jgi:DNA-binding transcriptional LysR family regulator
MDELKAVRYFMKVVECGSFTQAAHHFKVPASSLSRRVSDLEKHLEASLLKRSTRVVKLTEIGEQYYHQVVELINQLDQSNEAVRNYQTKPMGRLKVSAMTGLGQKIVLPLLDELTQRYPDIRLDVHLTDEISSLANDEVDIAFRGGYAPNERVTAVKLMDNSFIPVASKRYFERYGKPTHVNELKLHKGLYYRTPMGHTPWLCELDGQWQDVSAPIHLCCNDGAWLIEKAIKGDGILMLPRWVLAPYLESGQLIALTFTHVLSVSPNPDIGIFLLYQKQRYHIPKVKAAIDFLVERIKKDQN